MDWKKLELKRERRRINDQIRMTMNWRRTMRRVRFKFCPKVMGLPWDDRETVYRKIRFYHFEEMPWDEHDHGEVEHKSHTYSFNLVHTKTTNGNEVTWLSIMQEGS